jgi:hypothetical protein
MRRILGLVVIVGCIAGVVSGAVGPQVQVIDGKLSIRAESLGLAHLLRLIDQATGLKSKVPPELANQTISVQFSGLNVDDAVRKVFEGQPIDYVFIQGHGIVVTALSQARREQPGSPFPPPAPAFQPIPEMPFPEEAPGFVPPQPPMPGVQPGVMVPGQMPPGAIPGNGPFNQQQAQPAIIQTPFGPIPNPRANQPAVGGTMPGQPFGAQQPFGGNPPFGAVPPNQNLFGNTSPAIMNSSPNTSPQQPRR